MQQPQVNDYIKWNSYNGLIQGWVYFSCSEYITIEVAVKPMGDASKDSLHENHHVLVVCYPESWCDIIKVGSRDSKYSNTIISYE